VVDRVGFQVTHDRVEYLGTMNVLAAAVPVDEAEPALAGKLGEPRPFCEMQVR
jgi:hypothetical protein